VKSNTKCRNWGGLGVMGHPWSLTMSTTDRAHTTSYSTQTMHLSCTVFKFKRVVCEKSQFYPTHLHLVPPLVVTPFEFCEDHWHQKTRVPGL